MRILILKIISRWYLVTYLNLFAPKSEIINRLELLSETLAQNNDENIKKKNGNYKANSRITKLQSKTK